MGVLPCYTTNCPNIMCDTYVYGNGTGEVCEDCQEKFIKWLCKKDIPLNLDSDKFIIEQLAEFQKEGVTIQDEDKLNEIKEKINQFFNLYTRN